MCTDYYSVACMFVQLCTVHCGILNVCACQLVLGHLSVIIGYVNIALCQTDWNVMLIIFLHLPTHV